MFSEKLEMGLLTGAIIISSFFIVHMVDRFLYLDMTKLGWKRARKNFPNVAAQFGLEYLLPKLNYQIGEIKGEYNGYKISIRPDDLAFIGVTQIGSSRFDNLRFKLSTSQSQLTSPPEGMMQFESGNSEFDAFFNTRYAIHDAAIILTNNPSNLVYIGQFRKAWKNKICYVEVDDFGVRCSLKYGVSSYIPADILEKILPDLCELAKIFESLLGAGNFENTNRVDSMKEIGGLDAV